MSLLGDFLKKQIKDKMEFHKRSASGESVETLREEIKDGHLLIWGVDYWEEINEGIPAGTNVSMTTLVDWVNNRSGRYSNKKDWGIASPQVQKKIAAGKAAINSQPERLHIIEKVVNENRAEITRQAESLVVQLLKLR
jgi:hypothetical protein